MLNQLISRMRRNHGLEHATIHMLSAKHKGFSAQGHSDHRGFSLNIFGDIDEEAVETAVFEAYRRMKAGDRELAVHPNCGTVLLTTATLSTLAAQASLGLEQRRQRESELSWPVLLNGLPAAILAVVLTLIISRPLGIMLQAKFTTEGDLGDLEVKSVRRVHPSPITRLFHFLLTGSDPTKRPTAYRVETIG